MERFTHLSPDDTKVWRQFLLQHPNKFAAFEYDVTLGNGTFLWPEDAGQPPYEWLAIARKRVDVVAQDSDGIAIIEVKPIARMAALGQILSYVWLYRKEKQPTRQVRPWVVCGKVDEDLKPIFAFYRVQVVSVWA